MSTFNQGTYQSGDGNLNEPILVGRLGQPLKLGGGPLFSSHGSGPIADRPSANEFGVGTWQDETGTLTTCDGSSWSAVGGVSGGSLALTASRNALSTDNGLFLINSTASNFTYTIQSGQATDFGLALVQESTGTVTVTAGVGVTFVGSLLVTAIAGDIISIIWVADNTYLIKVG
jgi:hypothetical protein